MFVAYHQTCQPTISSSTVSTSRRADALPPTGSVPLVGQGRPGYNRWKRITGAQSTRRIARCGGRHDPRWSSAAVSEWVCFLVCFLYKNTFCRSRSLSNATFSFLITSRSSSSKFAVLYKILWKSDDFCRAMLCKRGLCRHAVSVCLSVCPSLTCVSCVKANKHIVIFLPSGIQATVSNGIAIFRREPPWQGGGRMQVG